MYIYWKIFYWAAFISFIGYIWLIVVGFKRSVLWGFLVLLFSPITAVIFAISNWREAKKAFMVYGVAMLLIIGDGIAFFSKVGPEFIQLTEGVKKGTLTKEQARVQLDYLIRNGHMPPKQKSTTTQNPAQNPTQTSADDGAGKGTVKSSTDNSSKIGEQAKPQPATAEKAVAKPQPDKTTEKTVAKPQPDKTTDESANKQVAQPPVLNPNKVQPDPLVKKSKVPSDMVAVRLSRISHYLGHYFIFTMKNGNQHRGLLRKVETSKLVLDRKLYGGSFVYRIRKDEIKSIQMFRHVPDQP